MDVFLKINSFPIVRSPHFHVNHTKYVELFLTTCYGLKDQHLQKIPRSVDPFAPKDFASVGAESFKLGILCIFTWRPLFGFLLLCSRSYVFRVILIIT